MLLGGEMSASRSLGVCAGGSSRRPGGGPYAACSIVCCGRGALSVMSEKCGMMMLRKVAVGSELWGEEVAPLVNTAAGTTRHVARVINRRDRAIECAPCC